jgi:hypothetical protein
LSFVPMRMAASLTVTAMRSSNGDLADIVPSFLHPILALSDSDSAL